MKFTVKFNDVNEVRDFVDITSQYSEDLSLVRDRYIVDAKSILGIFSLDLTKPIELLCDRSNEKLMNDLSAFVVA